MMQKTRLGLALLLSVVLATGPSLSSESIKPGINLPDSNATAAGPQIIPQDDGKPSDADAPSPDAEKSSVTDAPSPDAEKSGDANAPSLGAEMFSADAPSSGAGKLSADVATSTTGNNNGSHTPLMIDIDSAFLYTKGYENGEEYEIISADNNTISKSNFQAGAKTFIIIHGFQSWATKPWILKLKEKMLEKDAGSNVITVQWKSQAGYNFSYKAYNETLKYIQPLGQSVARLVEALHIGKRLDYKDVHVIGLNLGAHIAGFAGKAKLPFGRITGLDPASRGFLGTAAAERLDKADAYYVDIIHSNSCNNWNVWSDCFGIYQSIGHTDFWPNGGKYQPACHNKKTKGLRCDHTIVTDYFIESFVYSTSTTRFLARPAKNYEAYCHGNVSCGSVPQYMGIFASSRSYRNHVQLIVLLIFEKMVRNYVKKAKPYNDETLKLALEEIASGVAIKDSARKHNIGYGKLWIEHKKHQESEDYQAATYTGKRGRKVALSDEMEAEILRCVKIMEKMGMPPPIAEFQSLIHDYLECNQCITPFLGNRPGRDWVNNFLKRHGLTLKKGGMMQLVSTPKRPATASTSTDSQTPSCSFWQSPASTEPALSQELKKCTDQQLVDELLSRDEAALSLLFKCLSSSISQRGKSSLPASIEAVLHSRGRGATPLTKKRRVIPMSSSIITDEKFRQKIVEMNEPKVKPRKKGAPTQTEKSKKEAPKKKATGKKRKLEEEDEDLDSTDVSSVAMTEANASSDLSLKDDLEEVQDNFEEATEERMEVTQGREETDDRKDKDRVGRHDGTTDDRTQVVTSESGTIEDADINKYVAVYFSHPKPQYFWGKVVKVFSSDEETDVTQVEVNFLQKKTIFSDPAAWTWAEKTVKEVLIIDTKFIVFGPLLPDVRKNIFRFPDVQVMISLCKFHERDG